MNENKALTVFSFQGSNVRIIMHNGEPWFVAVDVCNALGIKNSSNAIARLKENWKDEVDISDPIGRLQSTKIISEPAFYKFAFRSNKPSAEEFTDRVASEILPAIRKTGSYSVHKRTIHATSNRLLISPADEQQLILSYVARLQNPTARDLSRYLSRFTVKELRQWLHDLAERGLLAEWFTGHSYRYKIAPQKKLITTLKG